MKKLLLAVTMITTASSVVPSDNFFTQAYNALPTKEAVREALSTTAQRTATGYGIVRDNAKVGGRIAVNLASKALTKTVQAKDVAVAYTSSAYNALPTKEAVHANVSTMIQKASDGYGIAKDHVKLGSTMVADAASTLSTKATHLKDVAAKSTKAVLVHPKTQAVLNNLVESNAYVVARVKKVLAYQKAQTAMTKISDVTAPAIAKIKSSYNNLTDEQKVLLGVATGGLILYVFAKKMSKTPKATVEDAEERNKQQDAEQKFYINYCA